MYFIAANMPLTLFLFQDQHFLIILHSVHYVMVSKPISLLWVLPLYALVVIIRHMPVTLFNWGYQDILSTSKGSHVSRYRDQKKEKRKSLFPINH